MDINSEYKQAIDQLKEEESFGDGRRCGLCGVTWSISMMACDKEACECYCTICIEEGEVERYLLNNDYTPSMVREVINTLKK